jgi:hypothetical protein
MKIDLAKLKVVEKEYEDTSLVSNTLNSLVDLVLNGDSGGSESPIAISTLKDLGILVD